MIFYWLILITGILQMCLFFYQWIFENKVTFTNFTLGWFEIFYAVQGFQIKELKDEVDNLKNNE